MYVQEYIIIKLLETVFGYLFFFFKSTQLANNNIAINYKRVDKRPPWPYPSYYMRVQQHMHNDL